MIFHFRLFPGKTNNKIIQKMKKTPFLAHIASFLLILAKYHCAKFEKKKKQLISTFQEKLVSNGSTYGQAWIFRNLQANKVGVPKWDCAYAISAPLKYSAHNGDN